MHVWIIAFALIFVASASKADENETANRFFVNALNIIKEADGHNIYFRAKAYVNASGILSKILEDYTGSYIAVNLVAGAKIGAFDYEVFFSDTRFISPCVKLHSTDCANTIIDYSAMLIEGVEDSFDRASALRAIGSAQARAGRMEDAAKTVERIDDPIDRASGLRQIAEAQAAAGLVEDAAKTFAEALRTAAQINQPFRRAGAFLDIAVRQALAGFVEDALGTVERIDDPDIARSTLAEIAKAQVRAGLVDDALTTFEGIIDFWPAFGMEAIPEEIAVAQARAGRVADALMTAGRINHPFYRARALAGIAEALASAGLVADAFKAFSEAVRTARRIDDPVVRPLELEFIAGAQAKFGYFDQALKTALIIESVAGTSGKGAAHRALLEIAEAQAEAGLVKEAVQTIVMALETAEGIENVADKIYLFTNTAEALLKTINQ